MAIIPPRRDQPLTQNNIGHIRFLEYLEQVANTVNATPVEIEEQIFALVGAIQKTGALTNEIQTQIDSILQALGSQRAQSDELNKELSNAVQLLPNFGKLNVQIEELNNRISDLEQLQ